ncbi:hypothetical protein AB0K16_20530 [Nonomuraea jabiensis]|uniref:hypothetical protein n=1 Tax=Nonomuraea jabiensis TaxID=882448 RepID=UPI003434EFBF
MIGALGALSYGTIEARTHGRGSWITIGSLAAALVRLVKRRVAAFFRNHCVAHRREHVTEYPEQALGLGGTAGVPEDRPEGSVPALTLTPADVAFIEPGRGQSLMMGGPS